MPYSADSPIKGVGSADTAAIQGWFRRVNPNTPNDLGESIVEECEAAVTLDGKHPDPYIVSAQTAHETGYWTSAIAKDKNNPAGLGAENDDPYNKSIHFDSPRQGIHAQVAHLLSYTDGEANPWKTDDPRFNAVKSAGYLGTVHVLRDLEQKWAWSPPDQYAATPESQRYGSRIAALANELVSFAQQNGTQVSAVPTQADIGYPVSVEWADADVGPSRNIADVRWFVVHDTEGSRAGDLQVLEHADPAQASVHAWIAKSGELVFIVPLNRVSWTVANQAVDAVAINVELEGYATEQRTEDQYRSLAAFFRWCVSQGMTVPAEYVGKDERPGIIGHQDVANPNVPGAWGGASGHTDPGPLFDWNKLVSYINESTSAPQPQADNRYFPETQHYLSHGFLRFWESYGDQALSLFGYPISEEFSRSDGLTVQWLQRARFEWHPGSGGNPKNDWDVMLGLVGSEEAEDDKAAYPEAFAPRSR